MVTTIMVYKFTQLSRREIEQMMELRLQDTRVYQEAKEEGRQAEAVSLVLRLLSRRCGNLPEKIQQQVASLPLPTLENLSEALLEFTSLADLEAWLASQVRD